MVAQFNSDSNDNFNVNPTPEVPTPQPIGDNGFTLGQPLDPQPPRQGTIDWLLELGLPPLPVAPAQPDNSKFGGKNPSYLDTQGIPHLVSHGKYQKRQPTKEELDTWFANPLNGIGTLGNEECIWIDFDVKNFTDEVECSVKAWAVATKVKELSGYDPTIERTHSGGWRVQVYVKETPNFTNFALTPGGKYVGEALGAGRFTVLAPTIGPSGEPYEAYHRHCLESKPIVPSLEAIGIYPSSKSKSKSKASKSTSTLLQENTPPTDTTVSGGEAASSSPNVDASSSNSTSHATEILKKYPQLRDKTFELRDLGTDKTRDVLRGVDEKGDRSASLTTAIKDWYGWENWCRLNGFTYRGDTRSLAVEAGKKMPPGKDRKDEMDEKRVDAILKGIDANACKTSCEFKGGSDEGCWKRILRLAGVKGATRFFKNVFPVNPQPSPLNAKVIPLPTATPLPKAVGGNDNSPPLPPNYGGGSGGNDPNNKGNDWCPPVAHNGELGYWVKVKGEDEPIFDPKCDFDFVIDRHFIRYKSAQGKTTTPDGGGFKLKVTLAEDGSSHYVYVTGQAFRKVDMFEEALVARLGDSVSFKLSSHELKSLRRVKVKEYRKRGGKKYRLCDHIGKQVDGTWLFPDIQFDAKGKVLTEDESLWVYTPHIGEEDEIPSPDIPVAEDPNALRELLEAQRQFAQANFMRFWLLNGWVAACLHEQDIMRQEKFMPIVNAYGDGGSAKTTAMESALSLIWGDSGNGMIASASVSMAYERLGKTGSIPCFWDDPPSKDKKDREALDEFVKRQYNKAARTVRGNTQKPISSIGITSNHCVGETLPATASRMVGVFFPKVPGNKDAHPRLLKAMAKAPGAFRSLLTIGYNQTAVHETRKRLIPHLQYAHDRTPDNWALITWYAQRVVELAGMDIDVEAWFIENICPTLNEDQKGLDSSTDFIKRLMALHTENKAGAWNAKVITNRTHGECFALEMKTLWSALDRSGDPPPYNLKLLENVLVNKGCVRGVPTKFYATREGVLNYLRELGKGANQGDNWIPPTPPPQTSKRALLIPKRLWDEFGFDPDALAPMPTPPTPPSDDSGDWDAWDEEDVQAPSYTPVTSSYAQLQKSVTSSNVDVEDALGSSLTPSYIVTNFLEKKEREETAVELNDAQEKTDDAIDATEFSQTSKVVSEKSVTMKLDSNPTLETTTPQGVELVTKDCNLGVTLGGESVTSPETNPQTQALTPDLPPELALAAKLDRCDTWAQIQEKTVGVPVELYNEALAVLEDSGARIRRLEADALAQASTPNLESPTPNANLSPATSTDAELVAEAKRQGKAVFRYVGPMFPSGAHCLAPNTLVELLGVDCFGLLNSVKKLGEVWETPIKVGKKWLEEV